MTRGRARGLLVGLALFAACSGHGSPQEFSASWASAGLSAPVRPATAPLRWPPPSIEAGTTLWVASARGIAEVSTSGQRLRGVSTTPAKLPRWSSSVGALIFISTDAYGNARDLRELSPDGTEVTLAKVPVEPPCQVSDSAEDPVSLDVMSPDEFRLNGGTVACLVLADHSPELRDFERHVVVDLNSRETSAVVLQAPSGCEVSNADPPPCTSEGWGNEGLDDHPKLRAFSLSTSPDGQWTVVEIGATLGDYYHEQYGLYDERRGLLFPLRSYDVSDEDHHAWPADRDLPADHEPGDYVEGWPDVIIGETIEWVGPRHLVFGQMLYIAGERVVNLRGDVAVRGRITPAPPSPG